VELPLLLLVAFCAAVLLRTFVVQSFDIPSGSMENTLLVGDRVVVNKLIYEVREPQRGEVVVFRGSDRWHPEAQIDTDTTLTEDSLRILGDLVGIAAPNEKDLIKRIIGIGGDTVACCDEDGRVTVNGVSLDEPYIFENASEEADPTANDCRSRRFGPVDVPEGHMFVLGDHRGNSRDSRCQGFVPVENIIGRAVNIVWPKSSWASLGDVEVFADVPDAESAQAEASPSPKDSGGDSGVVAPLLLTGALFGRRRRRKRRYPDMSVLGSSPHVRSGDDRHTAPCCRHGP
ncbi:MAG: signal peptidase I, partial [Stackebrandtia sp.]